MDPATAADPSIWIPLTVPQGLPEPAPGQRQAARQLSTIDNATLYVDGNVTLTRTQVSRHRDTREDEHERLRLEVWRELGLLKPSGSYPRPERGRIATRLADEVMQRVPPGTRAPTKLRLIHLEPTVGQVSGRLVDGVAFKVAAWWPDAPPRPRSQLLDDRPGISVTPVPARSTATAAAGAPGCPARPGCAPAPSRRPR